METLRKISETVVTPRWHRAIIWFALLGIVIALSFSNARHNESEVDSVVLGAMATTMPPTVLCDSDGVIVFANTTAMEFLKEDLVQSIRGKSVITWMTPGVAAEHIERFKQANELPLGPVRPLDADLIVHGEPHPVILSIMVAEVKGDRVFRVTWLPRVINK